MKNEKVRVYYAHVHQHTIQPSFRCCYSLPRSHVTPTHTHTQARSQDTRVAAAENPRETGAGAATTRMTDSSTPHHTHLPVSPDAQLKSTRILSQKRHSRTPKRAQGTQTSTPTAQVPARVPCSGRLPHLLLTSSSPPPSPNEADVITRRALSRLACPLAPRMPSSLSLSPRSTAIVPCARSGSPRLALDHCTRLVRTARRLLLRR